MAGVQCILNSTALYGTQARYPATRKNTTTTWM